MILRSVTAATSMAAWWCPMVTDAVQVRQPLHQAPQADGVELDERAGRGTLVRERLMKHGKAMVLLQLRPIAELQSDLPSSPPR
jgi:hypothetical protein